MCSIMPSEASEAALRSQCMNAFLANMSLAHSFSTSLRLHTVKELFHETLVSVLCVQAYLFIVFPRYGGGVSLFRN